MAAQALLAVVLLSCVGGAAEAQTGAPPAKGAVVGHPGVTYFDLVRLAAPDLGGGTAAARRLADPDNDQRPLAKVIPNQIEAVRFRAAGRPRLALLAGSGGARDEAHGGTLLMLFDDAPPTPKLLDTADVGLPLPTAFAAPEQRALGAGDTALVLHDEHADPDLKLEDYLLVATAGDRLRTIASFRLSSEFVCGWTGVQTAAFASRPDPGRAFRRIEVTVRSIVTHPPGDCGPGWVPQAGTRLYLAGFRWSLAHHRYQPTNAELTRLEYDNERLFK